MTDSWESNKNVLDLLESAVLETVVPNHSEIDLQSLFQSSDKEFTPEQASIVPFIEQRQFLFLDEIVPIYVVLRIPAADEKIITSFLSQLSITVEAHITGQIILKQGEQLKDAKELQATETINIQDDALMLTTELQVEGEEKSSRFIYLLWKTTLPLGRPKQRLQKPCIFFTPSASFVPNQSRTSSSSGHDDYLPGLTTLPANILQQLQSTYSSPYLSSSHLLRTAPSQSIRADASPRPISCGLRRLFRVAPAFLWRVRFLRSPSLSEQNTILACFDLETTTFASAPVQFNKIDLDLSSGFYKSLGIDLPLVLQASEQSTLIYKITPPRQDGVDVELSLSSVERSMDIHITASVMISKSCTPMIKIQWKTPLELPPSRPPSRNTAMSPISPISTNSISANLGAATTLDTPAAIGHDVLTMTGQVAEIVHRPASMAEGISIAISAPEKIIVGNPFRWEILIINRSREVYRLALVALHKRKGAADALPLSKASQRPKSDDSTFDSSQKHEHSLEVKLANPVLDENVVYGVQKGAIMEPVGLVCLTPDVKVGPLPPSACYQTEILFLPLSTGSLPLDALKLVNLANSQSFDIKELPDIFSVSGASLNGQR